MAPRRVNAKLLIIVGVCLAFAGVAVGATWFLSRSNTAATLHEAEAAEQSGDRELAIELYAKVAKHPRFQRSGDLIMRIANLHATMPVESRRLAQFHLKHWFAWLRQAWRVNPETGPGSAFQQEMDGLMRLGFEIRRATSWDEMFQRTDEILAQYPHKTAALKYRGISQVNRMALAASNLTAEERSQAESDLRRALNEYPDDQQLVLHLARWHVLEAEVQDRVRVDRTKVTRLRDKAVALTGETVQRHPDDVDRRIDHVSVLMSLNRLEAMEPHIDMLGHQANSVPVSPLVTTNVVQLLLRRHALSAEPGNTRAFSDLLSRAVQLVQSGQKHHPNSPLLMVVLARLRQQEGENARAIAQYEYAWKGAGAETPLEFLIRFNARSRAKLGSLSLRLDVVERMTKGELRNEALDRIAEELAEAKARIGDAPGIRRLAGRLGYVRGDMNAAEQGLSTYVTSTGVESKKTLLEMAVARRRLGQWGAAAELYRRVLKRWPDEQQVREELARVYLAGKMLEEAETEIQWLFDHTGGDAASTMALRLELLLRKNHPDEARPLVRALRLPDVSTGVRLAGVAREVGMKAEAEVLAAKAHRIEPLDVNALVLAVETTTDKDKQLAYVQKSRTAGISEAILERVTDFINGQLDVSSASDTMRRTQIAEELNPAVRAARWYRYHAARGNLGQAREALAQFSGQQSLEPVYLLAVFDDALLRKAWDEAERIASRARRARDGQGADYAEGRFYLGRLSMARRRYANAVADFQAGLEKRGTYSEGWTWLAQALLGMRDLNAAQDAYVIAVQQKPDSVPALVGLAKVHAERGEPEAALNLFRRAYGFSPGDFTIANVYLHFEAEHGDIKRARTLREAILQREPGNVANRKALSMILAQQGHFEEAMSQVRLMGRYGSAERDIVIAEARVFAVTGKREEAAQRLIAFARDSTDGTGQDHRAVARELVHMGLEPYAISGYRRAVERGGSDQAAAMRELADLLIRKNDEQALAEARELYRKLWNMDRMDLAVGCAYARLLVLNRTLEEAAQVRDVLLESHGRNVETLVLSAQVAAASEERAVAETSLDTAIKMAPQRADLYLGKAQLLRLDATRHGDALSLLDQALELNPLLVEAQALKARIYDVRNEVTSAVAEYEKLLRLEPDHAGRLRLSDLYREHGYAAQLKALLDESVERYPTSADWRRQQALFAQRQNNAPLALKYMKEAFRLLKEKGLIPKRVGVLREVVRLMIQLEEAEDAVSILRDNMILLRRDPVLQALRGRAVHMQGDDRASSYLRTALKDAAEKTKAADRRIFIETVKEVDAALGLEETRALVEEIQTSAGAPVWIGLGLASLELSAADYAAVVHRLGRLEYKVYRLPATDQATFYGMYGEALDETGQQDLAAAAFDHLVRVDPDDPNARHRLAVILAESEKKDERQAAVERARQAVALRPADPRFLETLGWSLFRAGKVAEAREAIQASLKAGATPLAHLHMAELELEAGDSRRESAIFHLRNAVKHAEQVEDSETLVVAERRLEELGVHRATGGVMAGSVDASVTDERPKTLRDMADRLLRGATLSVAILEESRQRWQNGDQDLETGFAYAGELIVGQWYGEADSVLQQLQSAHGENTYTYVLSTLLHAAAEAYTQAELNIEAALRLSPRWAALHLARARLTARDDSGFEEALEQLDEALALNPALAAAQELKGDIYRIRGEMNSAIRQYESLLRLAPKARRRLPLAELYFAVGRRMALKTLLDESEALFPRSSVWPHQQALLALHEGDSALALRKMRMAFARGKSSPLLRELVSLQLAADRADEALTALQSHSDLALAEPIFQALQGRALVMRGEEDAGFRQYDAALRQVDSLAAFMSVADQLRLGVGAVKAVEMATVVFGASPPTWAQLGLAAVEVDGEAYAEALVRLDALAGAAATMDEPQRLHYERARAVALHHVGRGAESETAYGRWRSLAPTDPAAHAGLGRLLIEELNRPEEAAKLLRGIWTARPNDPVLLDVLGLALWRVGENAEAKQLLEERLTLRPGAEANLFLAEIALEEGRRATAVARLNSAKEIAEQSNNDSHTLDAVDRLLSELKGDGDPNP